MKRRALVRHLESHGCRLLREGGSHSVYINPAARKDITTQAEVRCVHDPG